MVAYYGYWKPYVSVASRRAKAKKEMEKRRKQGQNVSPIVIEGRDIVKTVWGEAWCDNLERYSDYENRLPRGRSYVRNGSVVDLQIKTGEIHAVVSGSNMYKVTVKVAPVSKEQWKSICEDCGGAVSSLVELLQGRLSKAVMERICRAKKGLFPSPAEITISCSCPDWADMCKHVAAVMYGVGARFDHQPELLFLLRGVDEKDLIAKAAQAMPVGKKAPSKAKVLVAEDLGGIFGIDMDMGPNLIVAKGKPVKKKTATKKVVAAKKAAKKVTKKAVKKAT